MFVVYLRNNTMCARDYMSDDPEENHQKYISKAIVTSLSDHSLDTLSFTAIFASDLWSGCS